VEQRNADEADVAVDVGAAVKRLVIACPAMLLWVSTAPLGLPVVPECT